MAKYRITIQKVEDVKAKEQDWKELWSDNVYMEIRKEPNWDPDQRQNGYVEVEVTKEKATEIYDQTIEKDDFNIKDVIDAFNK